MSILCSQKLDTFYFLFFVHVIPIIAFVDLVPFYPKHLVPAPLLQLSSFYITTFRDPLVITKPPWFLFLVAAEAFVQFPIAVYMVSALRNGSKGVPLWGFVYGFLACFSTYACLSEFWWDGIKEDITGASLLMTTKQKWMITGCYGPYAAAFTLMTLDFGSRLYRALSMVERAELVEKRK